MRVVIDTNWLISYLIKIETSDLKLILANPSITIVTTEKQIREFLEKIYLPKFRKYFETELALDFIRNFAKKAEWVQLTSDVAICRDSKDNFFLSLSRDAGADILISGDGDLLTLGKFENTSICTLPEFIKNHYKK